MHLLQAIRNQGAQIGPKLEDSQLFSHMGDRGTFREAIIRDFLRPFLPCRYGLSTGEVFSRSGSQSGQIDVVIYDAVFSTILFRNGPVQLFPAESVFGSIEVKSNLSSEELDNACRNVASVKRLDRAGSDMLDLLPSLRLNVSTTFAYSQTKLNPYVGFVFAYRGIAREALAVDLNRRMAADPSNRQLLPDFVFVAQPGYAIVRCFQDRQQTTIAAPGNDFTQYMYLDTAQDTFPLFFLTLNLCLGMLRLRDVDYRQIWEELLMELVHKGSN
jgi:hypothetical protein